MNDESTIFRALESGAIGYLLKDAPPRVLLNSILDAHTGGSPMTATIARLVVKRFQNLNSSHLPKNLRIELLSPREKEIAEILIKGMQYKEIAATLGISLNTVRIHIRSIYKKLQVNSRAQLMARGQ